MSQIVLNNSNVPQPAHLLDLPEKVLQFGTGVLLRGLPDYFIHCANQKEVFNGRVVVVKSTSKGGTDEFTHQDNFFTHLTRGVYKGQVVNTHFINTSISRVLVAKKDWALLLALAKTDSIEVVISNTTEAGLVIEEGDVMNEQAPLSFPAKLLVLLFTRWKHYNGDMDKGWVILPTELVPDNGNLLLQLMQKLATKWGLPSAFMDWMINANEFCNTLVDRIVPGILTGDEMDNFSKEIGYKDDLLLTSEPFALWAIECSNEKAKKKMSFTAIDESIVVAPSVVKFRELKLRMLNGTHTFCCGVALLAGFETVVEAMNDATFYKFISTLVFNEIVPCVVSENITQEDAKKFGERVLERFANPFIKHKWTSISLNFEEKMKMRNQYLIEKYFEKCNVIAQHMSLGFAAFKIYMQQVHQKQINTTDYSTNASFAIKVQAWEEAIAQKGIQKILLYQDDIISWKQGMSI